MRALFVNYQDGTLITCEFDEMLYYQKKERIVLHGSERNYYNDMEGFMSVERISAEDYANYSQKLLSKGYIDFTAVSSFCAQNSLHVFDSELYDLIRQEDDYVEEEFDDEEEFDEEEEFEEEEEDDSEDRCLKTKQDLDAMLEEIKQAEEKGDI